jgi:hypothetical protein
VRPGCGTAPLERAHDNKKKGKIRMTIAGVLRLTALWVAFACFSIDASAAVSCTPDDLSSVAPTPNIDFATTIQPIIDTNCSACHEGRGLGGLDMSPGAAVANLVNVPSVITTAGIPRVTPFNTDQSFLFKKINCTDLNIDLGFRMPMAFEPGLPPPPPLSRQDQAAFRDWIVQGALAAAQPGITLGGYLSGNWFDPTPGQSGHGFQLEFTAQANAMIAIWFVYPPGGGGQNWIFAQGTFDPSTNTVTLPALMLSGPKFPPLYDSSDLQQIDWGTLTFTFTDCDHGSASWNSTVAGYGSGSMPIQRLTSIQGTACPQ